MDTMGKDSHKESGTLLGVAASLINKANQALLKADQADGARFVWALIYFNENASKGADFGRLFEKLSSEVVAAGPTARKARASNLTFCRSKIQQVAAAFYRWSDHKDFQAGVKSILEKVTWDLEAKSVRPAAGQSALPKQPEFLKMVALVEREARTTSSKVNDPTAVKALEEAITAAKAPLTVTSPVKGKGVTISAARALEARISTRVANLNTVGQALRALEVHQNAERPVWEKMSLRMVPKGGVAKDQTLSVYVKKAKAKKTK
tara:strand:+ start:544 stop:1335 length:792 start_codon:yes stop_codon:yes gene_type:complete